MRRLFALFAAVLFATQAHAITLGDRFMSSGYAASLPTTLNLDFTTGSNPSGYTFANSSGNRSYYNASGVLTLASADVARIGYYPVTLAGSWLLYENSATNLTWPSDLSGGQWTLSGVTRTLNSTTSPDGTTNATLIQENTATSAHFIADAGAPTTFTSGLSYTYSVYLKAGTATIIQVTTNGGQFPTTAYCNYNLSTGALGTCGAAATDGFIQDIGSGWYRVGFTASATSTGSNTTLYVSFTNENTSATRLPSFLGASKTAYAYGAQTEQASSASSYITTTTATVTRSADSATVYLPSGMDTITYTFDDDSTQAINGLAGGTYITVPNTLNRKRIKYIAGS